MTSPTKEYRKERYYRMRQSIPDGVCSQYPNCNNATEAGKKTCEFHLEKSRAQREKALARVKIAGQCSTIRCESKATEGFTTCQKCHDLAHARGATPEAVKRRHDSGQAIKLEVMSHYGGKCLCCNESGLAFLSIDHEDRFNGEGPRGGRHIYKWLKNKGFPKGYRVLCLKCNVTLGKFGYCPHSVLKQPLKERACKSPEGREYFRKHMLKFKIAAFDAYGGPSCKCCGEFYTECLSIDHINNDGASHRKEINKPLYRWLKDNNYPPGFQVLCLNCNFAKQLNGGICCPHKTELTNGS